MDLATIIGFVVGLACMAFAIMQGANGLKSFIDFPSILIVFGGTTAAILIMFPLNAVGQALGTFLKAVFHKPMDTSSVIAKMIDLSTIVRKDGLLALEKVRVDDPFLAKGVRLLVDGIDQNTIRGLLATEIRSIQDRHFDGAQIFEQIGAMAPAFGMIGTLIGLVQMLETLSDPSTIGPSMAIALITTFYGAFLANLAAIPIAKKLTIRSKEETSIKELIVEGVMSIAKKENPNLMKAKLNAFLAPKVRVS
ncbi:MAG: MotA/TolQ/ExbB proton channel family protein [Nitrospinae bacterium]|nr:MotA/TolQ/ExbB proton channel family protein [Nitrospinota bacterium]